MMKEWQRRVDEMAQGLCWVGYCWHGIGNRSLWLDSATSTATQRVARWRGLWKNHTIMAGAIRCANSKLDPWYGS
ncbi:uncharacterized protein [Physcomitrium patens]|uniref:uncharacterized protein isoform X3 n=1 Tax=Physcomitrium patens TaxID=3218 RepID=UPI003CCD4B02